MTDCTLSPVKPKLNGYSYVYVPSTGYGHYNAHEQLAHRHAYEQAHGPIPEGYEVHHRCHVKRCVNVEHLVAMPREEHRGRAGHGKLTRAAAEEIKRQLAAGRRGKDIADSFGVSPQLVCHIKKGRSWT